MVDLDGAATRASYSPLVVSGGGAPAPASFQARHSTPFAAGATAATDGAAPVLGGVVSLGIGSVAVNPEPYIIDQELRTFVPGSGFVRAPTFGANEDYTTDLFVGCDVVDGLVMFSNTDDPDSPTVPQFTQMNAGIAYENGTSGGNAGTIVEYRAQIQTTSGEPAGPLVRTTIQMADY